MAKPRVVQRHHLVYPGVDHPEQEAVVPIFKAEHMIATHMQLYLRKSTSKGFCKWLKYWLVLNEDRAIDLEKELK
ncbi:MAG: hypothetical protein M0R06_08715 [Sphaerochaeta sp.]|jgi:hypothetical protein|nr:hypothetical protein [Sphaerochaeta sp.]